MCWNWTALTWWYPPPTACPNRNGRLSALVALLMDADTVYRDLVQAGTAGLAWREGTPADWPDARLLAADEVLYGDGRMVNRNDRRYLREHAPEPDADSLPGENSP